MLFMFAGWFDHGKAAVLEQDREETGMSPFTANKWGLDKLTANELFKLLERFGCKPIEGMKKEGYLMALNGFVNGYKQTSTAASSGSASSNDGTDTILQALYEVRSDIMTAINELQPQKPTIIKHYHVASNGNDSDDDDDDNDDDQKEGTNDNDHNDDQNEGTNDNDQSDDDQNEGTNDDQGKTTAMSCTVKYHNSKNKDDQFSWDQTTTIEELKIMIITAHATMADGFRLCYCGKEVEDIRRVAEYLMVQDPKPFIAVVKLRGGGNSTYLNVLFIICFWFVCSFIVCFIGLFWHW
jgi:hypothetical protein